MTGRTGAPIPDQHRQAAVGAAKLLAVYVVDTHETVIPFGNEPSS